MDYIIKCSGDITLTPEGTAQCLDGWTSALYTAPFDFANISPVLMVEAFGAGLVLTLIPGIVIMQLAHVLKPLKRGF